MMKSLLSAFLIALSSLACLGQIPDSVKINNEWRYVYPVQEEIDFSSYYYHQLGIRGDEFPIWMEWKLADDPRAKLKSKKLHKAIYAEKYKRKEVRDSVPSKRHLTIQSAGLSFSREYEEDGKIYYSMPSKGLNSVPPVSTDLPSGKYVQFYKPYVTLDKGSSQRKILDKVCVLFELNKNELDNQFTRFNLSDDTLVNGKYDNGLRVGLWKELSEGKTYSNRLGVYSLVGVYNSGVKEGKFYEYYEKMVVSIEHYKNGEPVGQNTQITYQDSVVYDVFRAMDVTVDYQQFFRVRSEDFITGWRQKIDLKLLPVSYDFFRISRRLHEVKKLEKYKPLTDSVLIAGGYFQAKVTTQVPSFDTYYKVYDRKTQKLIYSCYLDTVTGKFSGSSWFSNGKQFDTIWTDGAKIHRIVYDLFGNELQSTLSKKESSGKWIDGYEVSTAFKLGHDGKKIDYYYIDNPVTRNDTVFDEMKWDLLEKLDYVNFHLINDSITQEIIFLKKGFIHNEKEKDTYISRYKHGELEVIRSEINKVWYFGIKVNGLEYEGPIKMIDKSTEKRRKCRLELTLNNKKVSFETISLIGPEVLGFFNEDVYYTELIGNIKGNHLDGKVILTDFYHNKRTELNYRNGLVNGNLKIWRYQKKQDQKIKIHAFEMDSSRHFSTKGLKKTFVAKTITLENGMLNGPLVYYLSNGDTTGVIPFKNGLKEGNAYRYFYEKDFLDGPTDRSFGSHRIEKGRFSNDKLVGELLIKEKSLFGLTIDTLVSAKFDEKGSLLSGFEKKEFEYRKEFGIQETQFNKRADGSIEFKKILDSKITESGVIYRGFQLSEDEYVNGILNTTKIYDDSVHFRFKSDLISMANFKDRENLVLSYSEFQLSTDPELRFYLTEGVDLPSYNDEYRPDEFEQLMVRARNSFNDGYYFKKYFPNGEVSREGEFARLPEGLRKSGLWKVADYNGNKRYELNYFDSLVKVGDQQWEIIGLQTDFDTLGNEVSKRYVLFEDATYQCSSDDYYMERQFITISAKDPNKMNGLTKNYYDNGALMNEGAMKNGLPEGLWKFYAPDGKLKRLGRYVEGKQNGKWLTGDLDEKAYIGGVCIDPDDPYYEFNVHSLENDKEIEVTIYKKGEIVTHINYGNNREGDLEIRSDIQLR